MMFESESESYQVSEFFEKFKNEFPKIVRVSQGFYGGNVTDTFDRDQVIRIHTTSSRRRVVAVVMEETDQNLRHYSFPVDYPLKFCLRKRSIFNGKKEFSLCEIIDKYKLPVEVQFAKNEQITLGSKSCSSGNIPALRLTHTFDEIYILGNFINNGTMDPRYVPIPLYIKELLLSLVKGIKGQTTAHWKSFQDEQTSIASTALKYDLNYGRDGIAVYGDVISEDTIYEKLQPDLYAEPYDFFQYQRIEMSRTGQENREHMQSSPVENVTKELCNKMKASTLNRSRMSDKTMISQYENLVANDTPPAIPPRKPNRNVVQSLNTSMRLASTGTKGVSATNLEYVLPENIEK